MSDNEEIVAKLKQIRESRGGHRAFVTKIGIGIENRNRNGGSSNKDSQVKLQRINLKQYDGDPLKFQSSWDSYECYP